MRLQKRNGVLRPSRLSVSSIFSVFFRAILSGSAFVWSQQNDAWFCSTLSSWCFGPSGGYPSCARRHVCSPSFCAGSSGSLAGLLQPLCVMGCRVSLLPSSTSSNGSWPGLLLRLKSKETSLGREKLFESMTCDVYGFSRNCVQRCSTNCGVMRYEHSMFVALCLGMLEVPAFVVAGRLATAMQWLG